MASKVLRKIIKIDEEKCDGCGSCVIACAEGAIQITDGKARLLSEIYCDGLGACLGECPQGALTIEERKSDEFDEEAVKHHLETRDSAPELLPCGCSSSNIVQFELMDEKEDLAQEATEVSRKSMLGHWPVQLRLVPPTAPFLQEADLVLAGDCVPFAYAGFHEKFLKDSALLVACPKLDNFKAHLAKLTDILSNSSVKSITVVHMEVPCCSGLLNMTKQAISDSGKDIPLREVTVGVQGELK